MRADVFAATARPSHTASMTCLHARVRLSRAAAILAMLLALPSRHARAEPVAVDVIRDRHDVPVIIDRMGTQPAQTWTCDARPEACELLLPKDSYWLRIPGNRHVPPASRQFSVRSPLRADVRAGSTSLRELGTATWVLGVVASALGLIAYSFAGSGQLKNGGAHTAPGVLLGVGVCLTLTGLIMVDQGATKISFHAGG